MVDFKATTVLCMHNKETKEEGGKNLVKEEEAAIYLHRRTLKREERLIIGRQHLFILHPYVL